MRALGHVKYIGQNMYELYEIPTKESWKLFTFRLDFIDFPGHIEPQVGDIFLNWYWVPIPVSVDFNTYGRESNLR